jgi:Fur family ferric uptake transcriptional regulator
MLYNNEITTLLNSKKIKSTAMRILVLQFFLDKNTAISLANLEEKFFFSERTTLYRTLKTFQEKGLVHQINDGTPSAKYALCNSTCSSKNHIDLHPHFYCEKCKETTCINTISIPTINIEKTKINSAELLIKGICDLCNKVA